MKIFNYSKTSLLTYGYKLLYHFYQIDSALSEDFRQILNADKQYLAQALTFVIRVV